MSITQLTAAAARDRMLNEINPNALGAKEQNQKKEIIMEVWLSLKTPDEQHGAATGGEVAGFVFLEDNKNYTYIKETMVHYGCQWGDDILQTNIS